MGQAQYKPSAQQTKRANLIPQLDLNIRSNLRETLETKRDGHGRLANPSFCCLDTCCNPRRQGYTRREILASPPLLVVAGDPTIGSPKPDRNSIVPSNLHLRPSLGLQKLERIDRRSEISSTTLNCNPQKKASHAPTPFPPEHFTLARQTHSNRNEIQKTERNIQLR